FWPPFFAGGEEALMAMDMVEQGWHIVYAQDVVGRRFPALTATDLRLRERLVLRNGIWLAWMRRPILSAWRRTCEQLGAARTYGLFWRTLVDAAWGLPRALRQRHVISPPVERMLALADRMGNLSPSLA